MERNSMTPGELAAYYAHLHEEEARESATAHGNYFSWRDQVMDTSAGFLKIPEKIFSYGLRPTSVIVLSEAYNLLRMGQRVNGAAIARKWGIHRTRATRALSDLAELGLLGREGKSYVANGAEEAIEKESAWFLIITPSLYHAAQKLGVDDPPYLILLAWLVRLDRRANPVNGQAVNALWVSKSKIHDDIGLTRESALKYLEHLEEVGVLASVNKESQARLVYNRFTETKSSIVRAHGGRAPGKGATGKCENYRLNWGLITKNAI